VSEPERSEHGVDSFRWCSKWPDQLAKVRVVIVGRDAAGRRRRVRRARPGEEDTAPLTHCAQVAGGWLGRRARNETGRHCAHLAEVMEGTKLQRSSVQRGLAELEQVGAIERRRYRRNGKTEYKLLPLDGLRAVTGGLTGGPTGRPTVGPQVAPPGGPTVGPLTTGSTTQGLQPPLPPAGGRQRDHDQWLVELRDWAGAAGLPDEHFGYVESAMRNLPRVQRTAAGVVAWLERFAEWPNTSAMTHVGDGPEQLELEL
jgi:hypothetical protein